MKLRVASLRMTLLGGCGREEATATAKAGLSTLLSAEFLAALHLGHHALLGFDAASSTHSFEELSHLGVLAQEVVYVLDGGAGAFGYALAPVAVDDLVVVAFLVGHGVDDGLDAGELAFVYVLGGLGHAGHGAYGGEHLEDGLHAAHFLDLTELLAEVV